MHFAALKLHTLSLIFNYKLSIWSFHNWFFSSFSNIANLFYLINEWTGFEREGVIFKLEGNSKEAFSRHVSAMFSNHDSVTRMT